MHSHQFWHLLPLTLLSFLSVTHNLQQAQGANDWWESSQEARQVTNFKEHGLPNSRPAWTQFNFMASEENNSSDNSSTTEASSSTTEASSSTTEASSSTTEASSSTTEASSSTTEASSSTTEASSSTTEASSSTTEASSSTTEASSSTTDASSSTTEASSSTTEASSSTTESASTTMASGGQPSGGNIIPQGSDEYYYYMYGNNGNCQGRVNLVGNFKHLYTDLEHLDGKMANVSRNAIRFEQVASLYDRIAVDFVHLTGEAAISADI